MENNNFLKELLEKIKKFINIIVDFLLSPSWQWGLFLSMAYYDPVISPIFFVLACYHTYIYIKEHK